MYTATGRSQSGELGQKVSQEERRHQLERQQGLEQIHGLGGLGRDLFGNAIHLAQPKVGPHRADECQPVVTLVLGATDALVGNIRLGEGIEGPIEPIAVQALELAPVAQPGRPCGGVDLNDLEPLVASLEPNRLVVAERVDASRQELVQLDLRLHQGAELDQLAVRPG